jgi:hypothetical protein
MFCRFQKRFYICRVEQLKQTIMEIILKLLNKEVSSKQITKWRNLNEKSKLCIVKILSNDSNNGNYIIAKLNNNGTITSLKDADENFMEDWYNKSTKLFKIDFKMAGWSKTQGRIQNNNNNNLKLEKMSKQEDVAKAKKVVVKKVKPAKAEKTEKAKKEPKAKTESKGPGVIASIFEFVQAGPVKESDIVKQLVKRFPERTEDSMTKTVKAQIGSNKQPVRMEREKNVTFNIVTDEKTKEKTYSIKK